MKAGINGFGRIGRNVFRAAHAQGADIDWVGVNDITDTQTLAQLLKYDSILGRFPGTVEATDGGISVDGKELKILAERDPAALPWGELGVDVVVESTGFFTDRDSASKHLARGRGQRSGHRDRGGQRPDQSRGPRPPAQVRQRPGRPVRGRRG